MVEILVGEPGDVSRWHANASQFCKHKFGFYRREHFAVLHEFVELIAYELHPRKTDDMEHHLVYLRTFSIVSDGDMDVLEFGNLRSCVRGRGRTTADIGCRVNRRREWKIEIKVKVEGYVGFFSQLDTLRGER